LSYRRTIHQSKRLICKWGDSLILSLLFFCSLQIQALAQPQPEDTVLFREGEILLSKGETEKALWRFKRLITDFSHSPLVNETKFRMGICYTQLKRPKEAISFLKELLPTFLTPTRMGQVLVLLGDNHLELKDPLAALLWYGKGLFVSGQPQEEVKRKMKSIIDSFDNEEDLIQIESLYRGAYAGGYAKKRLAQLAIKRGDSSLGKRILSELEKEYRGMDYLSQEKEIVGPISPPMPTKYTLGVILPLSGIHQSFGEKTLQGIQLALKEMEAQESSPLISLVIRDSKGNGWEAEKAVEELATKEKTIAILGPLLSNTTERAAKKAQQMKVPLSPFSQKEMQGDFLFQNSLTPSDQVQFLLDYAIKEMDLRTFAVFYPNSPYGLYFKNLFSQEVSRRGRKVSGVFVYQEDQTDFSQEIKAFFKIEPIKKSDPKKKGEEFKINVSVDGLFIPDVHDRVGIILSQMAYYDVKGLTFLGNNAWNGPGLISIGGKGAEGAIFVDAFFKQDTSPWVSRFVQEFRKIYQRDPEILEALGYDGAKFIKDILRSKSIPSPLQLKEEMRQIKDFQGVSGLKGFNEDGKAIRTLRILRMNKGQIESVQP
jgi:ABC-type branched-subunit amino acid transport system substrate-binding protein/outer membrane protein assembly factor BamD (BamD/ComL family)